MNMQNIVKKGGEHLLVIALFLVLVVAYFSPSILDEKVIQQGDMQKFSGMAQELNKYHEAGGSSAWTGSLFSGMPAYHIAVYGMAPNYLTYLERGFKIIDDMGGSMVFTGLICFYLLMCVMGVKRWLAIAGSIAFAFASYNIIIIVAGHITKAYVMAYMPLTLAGMVLLFRQKLLWGAVVFTLGVALSVMNGHLQITYYLAIFCLFLYLGYLTQQLKTKEYIQLLKVSGIMALCVVLAVLPNLGNLYSNLEVAETSMRGPSELTSVTTGNENKPSSGLDKDYAFEWSYGKSELLTLLVPNAFGGESGGMLDNNSELYKELKSKGAQVGNEIQSYTYWGNQMFTSGPVYFGALICFLFVLGMFVLKNPMKWWIAGGSLFFVFLAWGRNFEFFNDLMFHYLPMYNKFRTPSMALVIPGMAVPLVAIWGLKEILSGKVELPDLKKGLIWSVATTGGICLILWLVPGLFLNFRSALDAQYQLPDWYYNALLLDRESLTQADAFRSLIFILLGAALLCWFYASKEKNKTAMYVGAGIAVLMLIDLWPVDKRYLNDRNYINQRPEQTYIASAADKEILKDTDPSYRVLNLNNPFQETNTSFFHKSIGGYHAAKLRRYQELINYRLTKEIGGISTALQRAKTADDILQSLSESPSLNMLNMRYLIYNPEQAPLHNPFAFGNAWFIDKVEFVTNADDEMAALDRINPLKTVVIDKRFEAELKGFTPQPDSAATITLTSYKPDVLTYKSEAATEQFAVFSEIYYSPGWKAYVDGNLVPHFRVDWTLRGMLIPAGKHTIEFKFIPDTYIMTTRVASMASGVILLLLFIAIGFSIWNKRKEINS